MGQYEAFESLSTSTEGAFAIWFAVSHWGAGSQDISSGVLTLCPDAPILLQWLRAECEHLRTWGERVTVNAGLELQ